MEKTMSILQNLDTSNDIAESGDQSLSTIRESGLYVDTINKAYLTESAGGANAVVLELQDASGSKLRTTIYFTSGKAKGQKNYYENRDGEKRYLPGFELMENLCKLVTGKPLAQQDTQARTVPVYNFDAGAELPTEVTALHELWGKQILTGVVKQLVSKNVKNDAGAYVPTAETREQNEVIKFFDATTQQTLTERSGNVPANYVNDWRKKFEGKLINKVSKDAPTSGSPFTRPTGSAPGPVQSGQQVDSLFES
jgi:hypothetical protein